MTIRFKLTMGAIAAILVANSLLALVNIVYLERVWQGEVQTRVRLDLNSARAAYDNRIERIVQSLSTVALERTLASALHERSRPDMATWGARFCQVVPMDFVDILDAEGNAVFRAKNPDQHGDSLADNPLVSQVIREKKATAGSLILAADRLRMEGAPLEKRARLVRKTSPDTPSDAEEASTDGMVVAAAVPIFDEREQLTGILYGGNLLNRSYDLVDSIKQQVFPAETYEGKDIGTVTVFQHDLRIATNVIGPDGNRAVGTCMSDAVVERVLVNGRVWTAPAFVVDNWYITSYGPIRDPESHVIGALYVGLLQAPFDHAWTAIVWRFLVLMIVATVASLILIFLVTMVVMKPIARIVEMSRKVVAGDLAARVGIRPAGEMGVLCQAVDGMADALAEREFQLKQAVRQQVTRAEKLASIGRLAAGVAHEINNPLTGVLTFAHLMREKPNMDVQDQQDLDLIIHETTRAADIVRGLLDFARERPTRMEELDLNDAVRRTVRLIANQKKFERIAIEESLQPDLPEIRGDLNQLQQVLLNLSLNACAAMPHGGILTISTSAADDKVILKVTDTGCGIKEEDFDKIFEPFFTTQEVGKGTGLGLSVTYGIIEQHSGTLDVHSKEGEGSTFTIYLPVLKSQPR